MIKSGLIRRFATEPVHVAGRTSAGAEALRDVEPFLERLFADRELLRLPWQSVTGRLITKRRAPKVDAQCDAIGGGSPILRWSDGDGRDRARDRISAAVLVHHVGSSLNDLWRACDRTDLRDHFEGAIYRPVVCTSGVGRDGAGGAGRV